MVVIYEGSRMKRERRAMGEDGWFVLFVWPIWLNLVNQMNKTNQMNQINLCCGDTLG